MLVSVRLPEVVFGYLKFTMHVCVGVCAGYLKFTMRVCVLVSVRLPEVHDARVCWCLCGYLKFTRRMCVFGYLKFTMCVCVGVCAVT